METVNTVDRPPTLAPSLVVESYQQEPLEEQLVDHHALMDLDPITMDRLMLKSAYTGLQQAYAAAQIEHVRLDALLVDAQQEARLLTLQVRALVDLILEKKPAFRRSNPNQRHQAPPPPPTTANGTSLSSSATQLPPASSSSRPLVQ